MKTVIYVALLNEGTEVWRPVAASHVKGNIYQLQEMQQSDEEWQFPVGTQVRCEERTFFDGDKGLAAVEAVSQ